MTLISKIKEKYSVSILLIAWMGVIFFMSTDTFAFSRTSRYLVPFLQTFFPDLSMKQIHAIHGFLRKSGHFTEYAILSLLWFRTLQLGEKRWSNRAALLAFLLSALYAVTDEFHQSFVPSRGPSIIDVGIDSTGAAFSLMVIRLVNLGFFFKGVSNLRS